ncbi:MAG TPA: c-type cytochrome [Pyrinomonadaceae bacterium]|nr:c-type cytochrome [Pyrinomonadaceae bacterium]
MSKERLMRGVVCAAVTFAAAFVLWGHAVTRGAAQGPPQGDKPVEQTRKNIQVLKGLPESQLFPEMNFISASLGVQCGFCHVSQGKNAQGQTNWVWESDEKEEKKTAREMMKMVLAISGGNFGVSRGQVTCFTCHRGQEHPQSLPTLPLAVSGHEPPPAGATATPTPGAAPARPEQPTVQQVFDRYAAAVGSAEAVAKFQTMALKGTITASQGRTQSFDATLRFPDRYLLVTEGQQGGRTARALNGATGWVVDPRTRRELSAAELANARRSAELLAPVKFHPSATMRVVGRRKVGDRDAIVVVDRPSENVQRRYFFDAETGLLVRVLTLTDAVLNQIPEQVDFEDYRDVDGVKIPFTVRISAIDTFSSQTRTVTEVKHGQPVEDTIFVMPPAPPAPAATPKP